MGSAAGRPWGRTVRVGAAGRPHRPGSIGMGPVGWRVGLAAAGAGPSTCSGAGHAEPGSSRSVCGVLAKVPG